MTGQGRLAAQIGVANSTSSCSGRPGCGGAVYVVPRTNPISSVQAREDAEGQFTSCPGQVTYPVVQVGKGVGVQFYVLLWTWLLLVLVIRTGEQFIVLPRTRPKVCDFSYVPLR